MDRNKGLAAFFLSTIIWGGTAFLVKALSYEMTAAQIIFLRFSLAGLFLLLTLSPKKLFKTVKRDPKLFFLASFVGITLPGLAYIKAIDVLSIPVASFIADSYPALAILLGVMFIDEKPRREHLLAITAALLGLYLLTSPGTTIPQASFEGMLFALIASVCWGISSVVSKVLSDRVAPAELAAGRYFLGGVLAIPFLFLGGPVLPSASPAGWLTMIFLAAVSAFGLYLYYYGMQRLSLSTSQVIEACIPVVTLLAAYSLFGQTMTGTQLFGAALVFSGTVLVSIWPKRLRPTPS